MKRSRSNSGVTIAQHLRRLQQSGDSSSHIIIGASDYDPSRSKVSREEWVLLERNAASGLQGVARENFRPSLLVMDHTTDNSHTPFCVINGKQSHSQTLWGWFGNVTNNSSEVVKCIDTSVCVKLSSLLLSGRYFIPSFLCPFPLPPSFLISPLRFLSSFLPPPLPPEQISVGLMLKNPLRVPLLLRQLSLVWQFREHSNETNSSPGASSEVLERVVLQPEEQRMVRDVCLVHSVLVLFPSLGCLQRLIASSSLVPRPHPAGWGLGTRLCFQYMNIVKDGLRDLITYLWWKNWTWGILLMTSVK